MSKTESEIRDDKSVPELTRDLLQRILNQLTRLDDRVADLSEEVKMIRETMIQIRARQIVEENAEEGRLFLAERTTHDTDPAPSSNGEGK